LIAFGLIYAWLYRKRSLVARLEDEVGELEAAMETA